MTAGTGPTGTRKLRMEHMTFEEIELALGSGLRTAVVPCGAIEQHGRHLPLDVDAVHAQRLGHEIAKRLGDALVAPTIAVGVSTHHMAFRGTISLRPETLEAIYLDYCNSLASHGFRNILCFSGHGGNFALLRSMEPRLFQAVGPSTRVIAFSDLPGFIEVWRAAIVEEGAAADHVGGHADIAESSIYEYLRPGQVRTSRMVRGYMGATDDALLHKLFTEGLMSISDTGILGDPHGFNQEIGRRCVERGADMIAGYFDARLREVDGDHSVMPSRERNVR